MPKLYKDWPNSKTITVAELIAELSKYRQDMPVAYTWEGQVLPVVLEEIEVMTKSESVCCPVLLLDADT
jgi:hypothetical protein